MFQLIRIVVWGLAAIGALVYGYTGKITYRLDGEDLVVKTDEFLGRMVSERAIPRGQIETVEVRIGGGPRRLRSNALVVSGKDGKELMSDTLSTRHEQEAVAAGLRAALQRQSPDPYEISCNHTKMKGWFICVAFLLLGLCESYDWIREHRSKMRQL